MRVNLEQLRAENRLRTLREPCPPGAVNLSSNDYMGLAAEGALWREFLEQESGNFGGGACSSRLLTGNSPEAVALENALAEWYGEPALLFNSGYHANLGILPAVSARGDLILADKLVHASLIDGIRLSGAQCVRFPHQDLERLETLLAQRREKFDRVFIVTESIFSMDGDCTNLRQLVTLKKKYNALLYVDEAHAVGVRGPHGLGLAEEQGVLHDIDVLVGTFGKAYASQGAFVITSDVRREFLINTARPLIFSTALPPFSLRWTLIAGEWLRSQNARRLHLKKLGEMLGGTSHIVPLIVGDNEKVVRFSDYLGANGFHVLPIRAPSVPAGGERLRISLHAGLTAQHMERFLALCKAFGG